MKEKSVVAKRLLVLDTYVSSEYAVVVLKRISRPLPGVC